MINIPNTINVIDSNVDIQPNDIEEYFGNVHGEQEGDIFSPLSKERDS